MSGSGDYISREAAVELLSQPITMSMCLSVKECHHKIAQQRIDRYLVENIHAADVRPVVLCRDCNYWKLSKISSSFHVCTYVCGATFVRKAEDFCSRGEKREES